MNREDQVLYLENLRNLETLKHFLTTNKASCNNKISQAQEKIKEKKLIPQDTPVFIGGLGVDIAEHLIKLSKTSSYVNFGKIALEGTKVSISYSGSAGSRFFTYCFRYMFPTILGVWALIPLIFAVHALIDDISTAIRYRKYNKEVAMKKPQVLKEIAEITDLRQTIESELAQINQLLAEGYSFNLIPTQFRSISYIVYLYDYMSTSQQSLESALLHSHMEEAVKQISDKLDIIIRQNMEIISLLGCNLAANSVINSQLQSISSDLKLNNHLLNVNNYYYLKCIFHPGFISTIVGNYNLHFMSYSLFQAFRIIC